MKHEHFRQLLRTFDEQHGSRTEAVLYGGREWRTYRRRYGLGHQMKVHNWRSKMFLDWPPQWAQPKLQFPSNPLRKTKTGIEAVRFFLDHAELSSLFKLSTL